MLGHGPRSKKQGSQGTCLLNGYGKDVVLPTVNSYASSGYYNPLLAYGEEKAIQDAVEAGANAFIVVDLPPEEAVSFREKCRTYRCAYHSSCHTLC